jgi:muconate cycloisomerase
MPTIDSIEVFSFTLPFKGLFRTSKGTVGSAATGRPIVLTKLTASDGTVGWGEGSPSHTWSPETRESVVGALEDHFIPAVIGKPLADFDGLHAAMDGAIAPLWGLSMPIARAAIDVAAHDALARHYGVPLYDVLGQRRADRVRLSWTVTGGTPEEVADSLHEAEERGYLSCNVKVGGAKAWDLELCALVKRAFPDGFLWADANGGFPPHEAHQRMHALVDAGVDLLEQPVAPDRPDVSAQIAAASPIPIALDESISGPVPLLTMIKQNALTAYTFKVTRTGGLWPNRICASMADAAGFMLVCSGLTECSVAFAASVHLAAAWGVTHPCALNGPQFLTDDIAAKVLPREGDAVLLTGDPGLGIEVDEDKVRQLAAQEA